MTNDKFFDSIDDNAGTAHIPKLSAIYQEVILDHNRNPRNFVTEPSKDFTSFARGVNPLCGDHFNVYVANLDGTIRRVELSGEGCAISKASGDMMASAVKGKSNKEAMDLASHFVHLLTDNTVAMEHREGVGKLKFFESVKDFPIRVKCATLPWRALEVALKEDSAKKEVSTE